MQCLDAASVRHFVLLVFSKSAGMSSIPCEPVQQIATAWPAGNAVKLQNWLGMVHKTNGM